MAFPVSAIGIEGYEKRLEISFEPNMLADPYSMCLHTLNKQQLGEILEPAECTIVACLSNSCGLLCPL